mgnify:CR=1 FL=1
MRTPEELRALWIEALRSDKYEQTTGILRRVHDVDSELIRKYSFCCLGVACELFQEEFKGKWYYNTGALYTTPEGQVDTGLDDQMRGALGISHDLHELCIRLNDTYQFTFEMIARVVECMFEYEDRPEYLSTISDAWER